MFFLLWCNCVLKIEISPSSHQCSPLERYVEYFFPLLCAGSNAGYRSQNFQGGRGISHSQGSAPLFAELCGVCTYNIFMVA